MMNKRNWRIGMVVFTLFLVFCAGRMMIADATEAKENTVALLQNADSDSAQEQQTDLTEPTDQPAPSPSPKAEGKVASSSGGMSKEMRAVWIYFSEIGRAHV